MVTRCHAPRCTDGPPLDEQPSGPRLTRDSENLCPRCAGMLEQRLGALPALATALADLLDRDGLRGQRAGSGNKPTKGGPPTEFHIDAHDTRRDLDDVLTSWVFLHCEEQHLRGPDLTGTDRAARAANWLLAHLSLLLAHDTAGDLAEEVRDLHTTAESIARTQPGRHRLPAPCPDCGAFGLHRLDGDDHVLCRSCGLTWHEKDYNRLVLVLAHDQGTSVTASQAAERAGVTAEAFRQWVARGRVRRLGTVDGLARYSTADIDRLLEQRQEAS